jgi:alpha-L-rhamnosidase
MPSPFLSPIRRVVGKIPQSTVTRRLACVLLLTTCALQAGELFALKELQQTPVAPASIKRTADHDYFIDFERDAFGWLQLEIDAPADGELTVRLGEKLKDGAIDLKPNGSIRSAQVKLAYKAGRKSYRVNTPVDKRNTSDKAIRLPRELGVVMPFRYAEVLNAPREINARSATQIMVHYPFNDSASSFHCSDERLIKVWDLCKYTIKATSFAGIYVDGDRERIPYEADAYLNQLSHYGVDADVAMARRSHEYLLNNPTWPTEWKQISVLKAYQDWMYSGDVDSIRRNWEALKNEKIFSSRARADGLIDSKGLRDIVDWPKTECDGYVMSPVNTVVNAFHYRSLVCMAEMARAIGKAGESGSFQLEARRFYDAFNEKLFDPASGIYLDGVGIRHSSLHANLFPLAFGLVPEQRKPAVIAFIKSRGMACSVYPAQFLLEGLFESGEAEAAIALMTANHERSWLNMLAFGSTMTTEAWDMKFKNNLDWNHAWGAAPANIIPRYLLGVRPLEPGFAKAIIAPQLGKLPYAEGLVPTILGGVGVKARPGKVEVDVPKGMTAAVIVPGTTRRVEVGAGRHVIAR